MNRQTIIGLSIAGLAVVGGVAWALSGGDGAAESSLPPEYSAENLKAQAQQDPGALRQTMRKAFEDETLTDQQKRELRQNVGNSMRSMMKERMDEYFSASPEERVAVLDRHIDEFTAQMAEWREERDRRRAEREARGESEEDERQRWRERMRQDTSPEQRKARSESRNPDDMVRMMSYFSAARARAEERGIEMRGPWGRGGGPGRRGGG